MVGDLMSRNRNKDTGWTEVSVRVPVAVQEAAIAWAMDHGAAGVQEEYPGLGDLHDAGPIVSGDPSEWSGDAPVNPGDFATLRIWFPRVRWTSESRVSFLNYLAGLPGGDAPAVRARRVEDTDWAASLRREWRPIEVGRRFLVCPSFVRRAGRGDRTVLRLRPGMAFGTGTHFTTASCLEMIEGILTRAGDPGALRVLDVGTGSGVLAIAALLLGASEAVGVDLDREALREARQNARLNRVADRFRTPPGPLDPDATGRFPLVIANLVASTLVDLADPLARSLTPGGRLLVSGILRRQEAQVIEAFRSRGLTPGAAMRDGTWVTIVLDSSSPA